MTAVYNLALAPSAMAKSRLHRPRPSAALSFMMIGNVSKHVISTVFHLPKKLSCIPDQVTSPQERVLFPSEIHSQEQSSCTLTSWDSRGENEYQSSSHATNVATEPTATWPGAPILPMDQLEAALSRTSLVLDETTTSEAPDTPKTKQPSQHISISVRPQNSQPSVRDIPMIRTPSTTGSEIHFRPLSPPPDHFRRRNGQQPASPPPSPHRSHMRQRPRTVSLHQVLSCDSLSNGQGDVPDVPPVGELYEHRGRVPARQSAVIMAEY